MYNYILYTKARYLERKSILGMKIPVPSLARNGTTNWPTKCVKQDKQDIGDCEHIKLKPKNIETGRHKLFQKNM